MNWLSKTRQKRCWRRLNSGELLLMICLLSRRQGCYSFSQIIIHTIFSYIVLFARHVELILLIRIRYLKIIRLFMKRYWRWSKNRLWEERMEAGHDRCALSFCYRIWLKTGLHHDKNLV